MGCALSCTKDGTADSVCAIENHQAWIFLEKDLVNCIVRVSVGLASVLSGNEKNTKF